MFWRNKVTVLMWNHPLLTHSVELDGTVYSRKWSLGAELWCGVLEWSQHSAPRLHFIEYTVPNWGLNIGKDFLEFLIL